MKALLQPSSYSKIELLARIAAGDEKAFRILFDEYEGWFYSVVLKMTGSKTVAEEIVQDIFLHVWLNRKSLTKIDNPDNYFFTAVYRKVYTYFRKMSLEHNVRKMLLAASPQVDNTTDQIVLSRESKRLINEAIAKLPPQQQLVFRLSKQDGLSREQVAEQLHISPHTVKNHLADAIRFIRTYLKQAALLFLLIISSYR